MKNSCSEKKCKRCGWCCTNLGKEIDLNPDEDEKLKRIVFEKSGVIYVRSLRKFFLAMKKDEKDRMEKRGKELGIKVEIFPNKLIYDKSKDSVLVFDYYLNHTECPFYEEGKGCKIYEDRPSACKKYPKVDHSYSKEVFDFVKKNKLDFEGVSYEEALKKCKEFLEK